MKAGNCDCDVQKLLERERQYSKWDDSSGAVWCMEHRAWVRFTVPDGGLRTPLKVRASG